jgi:hypothetical protein
VSIFFVFLVDLGITATHFFGKELGTHVSEVIYKGLGGGRD